MTRHVLYIYRTDGSYRMITHHTDHLWQAKRFLDLLLDAEQWEWDTKRIVASQPQLITGHGLKVRGDTLERIVAHEYTKDELQLMLSDAEERRARQIMLAMPDPDEVHEAIAQERSERKARKETTAKIDRSGKVTISEIAEELDMEPKDARAILRALKIEKPLGGWLFDPAEVDTIKEQLNTNRKDQ